MEFVAVTGENRLCACGESLKFFRSTSRYGKTCGSRMCLRGRSDQLKRERAAHSPRLACVGCGHLLGIFSGQRPGRRCPACAAIGRRGKKNKPAGPSIPCADCGALVWRGTKRCAQCERARRPSKNRTPRECAGCRVTFTPKKTGNKGLYCSRSCAFTHAAKWIKNGEPKREPKPQFCRVYFPSCRFCRCAFTARHAARMVCSDRCAADQAKTSSAARTVANRAAIKRACRCCEKMFTPQHQANERFCSDECKRTHSACLPSARAAKAIAKAKRNAKQKLTAVQSIDPYTIFRRDNWRCRACGCGTPLSLRGTNADNSPELDHVVPLSRGGQHTMDNLQTLCRLCNIFKADDDMETFVGKYFGQRRRPEPRIAA